MIVEGRRTQLRESEDPRGGDHVAVAVLRTNPLRVIEARHLTSARPAVWCTSSITAAAAVPAPGQRRLGRQIQRRHHEQY
jgi:hypothetical protein